MENRLIELLKNRKTSEEMGVYSACTANEPVIREVLIKAKETNTTAVIEATANQVDQYGGYTGMKPKDFFNMVHALAKEVDIDLSRVILGGDHLGPLTFIKYDEEKAMAEARTLVREYVLAGFTKMHIDTSMRVASDSTTEPLATSTIARRAAELIQVTEAAYQDLLKENSEAPRLAYIIGSEVPIPGGATEAEEMQVTTVEDFSATVEEFKHQLESHGVGHVFEQVVGVVVQPGVEYGDEKVDFYNRDAAKDLTDSLDKFAPIVFEGHSTDYQSKYHLKQMVEDGIAILKVGPGLTFAYREALFALSYIEKQLINPEQQGKFIETLEEVMLENPGSWKPYYHGDEGQLAMKRAFSFSDRARYYLPHEKVDEAINKLLSNLNNVDLPMNLISQFLPVQYRKVNEGKLAKTPEALISDVVGVTLDDYIFAIKR